MAEKFPLKAIFDGGGAATDLAEFAVGDFVGLSSGGLGFNTIAGGDLMVGAVGGGSIAKLPIGGPSTVLMISSGVPAWQLITNANISPSAAIDWSKMNGPLPSSQIPNPLILARAAASAIDAHLILDQLSSGAGAPMNFRRNGAVRSNIYLDITDDLVFRTASGAAGSETFTESMRLVQPGGGNAGIRAPLVAARKSTATDGYVRMVPGDASNTGYIEWYKPGASRIAYMGFGDGNWLNLNLETGGLYLIAASTLSAAQKIAYNPPNANAPHLDIIRSDSSYNERIAFRGSSTYDVYLGRAAGSDALSISRWSGAGAPEEMAAFIPLTSTLTVVGHVTAGLGVGAGGMVRATGVAIPAGASGNGNGVELYHDGTQAAVQNFNRSTSEYGPLWLVGNKIQMAPLGSVKWTIDSSGIVNTSNPYTQYVGATQTASMLRFYADGSNAILRHGAPSGSAVYFQDSTGGTIGYFSADGGWTYKTNYAAYGHFFRNDHSTGYGIVTRVANDNYPALGVQNAAGAFVWYIVGGGAMYTSGNITSPTIQARHPFDPQTHGFVAATKGDAANVGYFEWWKPGPTRVAYMGYGAGTYLALNLESSSLLIQGGNVEIGNNLILGFRDSGGTGKAGLGISSGNVMTLGEPTIPLRHAALSMSFYNKVGTVALQTITGSRGGNAALTTLLTALHNLNLINDTSTA